MALVYSTEGGRTCPDCGQPTAACRCGPAEPPAGDGIVRVSRETKGRKGKGVTLISGLALPEKDLKALAKTLKAKCGTGGTVKDFVIEIQGDQRDTLVLELEKLGYRVKRAGG
ncbi:translation initiation factor Sui1 [Saccharospirillum mangrovi]|uniref:translation initiation factor Sui1 n=1 Tax=Saccharospirillum mangrovi TaxID=2161747 RepID=UPI000D3C883A|nr:translation initiation factor Sui1 [Saccharospirillum mangrovi]